MSYPPVNPYERFPLPTDDDWTPAAGAWLFEIPPENPKVTLFKVGANSLTTARKTLESSPTRRQWAIGPPYGANDLADFQPDIYYQGPYSQLSWLWFLTQFEALIRAGVFAGIAEAQAFLTDYGHILDPSYRYYQAHGAPADFEAMHNVLVQTRAGAMSGVEAPKLWSKPWHEAAIETFRRGWQYTIEHTVTRQRTYSSRYRGVFHVRDMLGTPNYLQEAASPEIPVQVGQQFGPFNLGESGSTGCPDLTHAGSVSMECHPDYGHMVYHFTLTSNGQTQNKISVGSGLAKVLTCHVNSQSIGTIFGDSAPINYNETRQTTETGRFTA